MLDDRASFVRRQNDEAAAWRKRVSDRSQTLVEIRKMGNFAVLGAGSLLNFTNYSGEVEAFTSFSSWRETLECSPMYYAISDVPKRGYFRRATRDRWDRMESAIQSLASMILLSVKDTDDPTLVRSFAQLKLWAVENGMTQRGQDPVLQSLKWLMKVAQSIFLNCEIEESPMRTPRDGEVIAPFDGPLRFVSDFYYKRRNRSNGLSLSEGRALAQLSNYSRSMPYPSREQTVLSVQKSVDAFSRVEHHSSSKGLTTHRRGLDRYAKMIGPITSCKTHVSLSNSGCVERSRSEGGKSAYLIQLAKKATVHEVDEELIDTMAGRVDALGLEILPVTCAEMLRTAIRTYDRPIQFGKVMYVKPENIDDVLSRGYDVPSRLGEIIANISSLDLLKIGDYTVPHYCDYDLISFDRRNRESIEFRPMVNSLRVKAGISVEAGMKARLTTSAPAAVTQIGQLLNNQIREHLSKDPLLRIGFDEADKLWEVLRVYSKRESARRLKAMRDSLEI
jgi:hypothetical protein